MAQYGRKPYNHRELFVPATLVTTILHTSIYTLPQHGCRVNLRFNVLGLWEKVKSAHTLDLIVWACTKKDTNIACLRLDMSTLIHTCTLQDTYTMCFGRSARSWSKNA